jgi:signal transduction histidine kinase
VTQIQIARQTESFTSTVSHEMRTPIGTVIFFLTQVIQALETIQESSPMIIRYLQLSLSQLEFMLSFVEDLLDFRQLKDGIFNLNKAVFDPNELLSTVRSIF